MSSNDPFPVGGPMFTISAKPCEACAAGRHEHRSPYGCARSMGSNICCGCKAPMTTPICGRCGGAIEGEPRLSSAEYIHTTC
jgi:hypothetical protein